MNHDKLFCSTICLAHSNNSQIILKWRLVINSICMIIMTCSITEKVESEYIVDLKKPYDKMYKYFSIN